VTTDSYQDIPYNTTEVSTHVLYVKAL